MEEQMKQLEAQVIASTRKLIGKNVQARRKQLGLTADTLAHKANLDRSYISRIETGKVTISHFNLMKLANALELPNTESLSENANEVVKQFIDEINKEE